MLNNEQIHSLIDALRDSKGHRFPVSIQPHGRGEHGKGEPSKDIRHVLVAQIHPRLT